MDVLGGLALESNMVRETIGSSFAEVPYQWQRVRAFLQLDYRAGT